MPVKTNNVYGNIIISNSTIEKFVERTSLECYGIAEFVSDGVVRTILEKFFKKSMTKGVKVRTTSNRIFIDVFVILKFGLSINATAESLRETIKYKVEKFTGMLVDTVNINIMGIKI